MSILKTVKGSPLFYDLYDDEIVQIVETCTVRSLEPGEYIFKDGDEGNEIYIVLSGNALVKKGEYELARLRKGDLFGELVLLHEKYRNADVISDNYTDVLIIEYNTIFKMYETHPKMFALLILNLSRLLAKRLKGAGDTIKDLKIELADINKKKAA